MYKVKIKRKLNTFIVKPVRRQVIVHGRSKRGLKGDQGIDGKSAYQIWLDDGNIGTEQDFFDSLKGDQGDTGPGVPTGGTTGQFLKKTSGTDYATTFANILQSDVQGLVSALSSINDDITDLSQGLVDANESISDVGDAVDALETDLATTNTNVTNLDTRLDTAESDINTLETTKADIAYTDAQIAALFRDSDITYTVGTGGDYGTINEAITALTRLKPLYKSNGFAATINLLSGFVMAEQVFVRKQDLSWITITSVDAEVAIDASAITAEIVDEEDITPIMGATDNAHLPILDVLFTYPDQGDGYAASPKDGIIITHNSHVLFRPGAGVKRPRFGLKVLYGSSATCYMPGLTQGGAGAGAGTVTGVDFSYASNIAVHVGYGSKANMARSILHHGKGTYAVYVIWASHVDLYQSQINDSTGNAITCRDGSYANMRETTVARSRRGYHALHNSRINARSHPNMWTTDSAKDCTQYGILCSYNSHIDASEVDVSGSATGVNVSGGSSVNFDIGYANNCSSRGLSAVQGSTINATGTEADSCGVGFYAEGASTINASGTHANSCTSIGYQAVYGSTINADSTSATGAGTDAYRADESSTIQARNSIANNAGQYGFNANRSSTINARGSSATGCVIGFNAFEGSSINAQSTTAASASTWGYLVDRGSEINAGSNAGTVNQTKNVRTGKGLISDASLTGGDGNTATWGQITGTLSAQTDLNSALALKANDNAVVHTTGDESIAGVKTLTGSTDYTSASTGTRFFNSADQTTDYEMGKLAWNANRFELSVASGGAGAVRQVGLQANDTGTGNVRFTLDRNASPFAIVTHSNTSAARTVLQVSGTSTSSASAYISLAVAPTINQTSTGSYTALLVNPTETATGSGTKRLLDLQVGGTTKFNVDNTGITQLYSTTMQKTGTAFRAYGPADDRYIEVIADGTWGRLRTGGSLSGIAVGGTTTVFDSGVVFNGSGNIANRGNSNLSHDMGTTAIYYRTAYVQKIFYNSTANIDGAAAGQLLVTGMIGMGAAPTHTITLNSTSTGVALYNTADQTTNYERGILAWGSNVLSLTTGASGTGTIRTLRLAGGASQFDLLDGSNSSGFYQFTRGSSAVSAFGVVTLGTWNATSTVQTMFDVRPTINQSGTAGYTALRVNPTETAVGSGLKSLADFMVGGTSKTRIDNTGTHTLSSTALIYQYNTADETTNYERVAHFWTGNTWKLETQSAGTGTARNLFIGDAGGYLQFIPAASGGAPKFKYDRSSATTGSLFEVASSGGMTGASGVQYAFRIDPIVNQTSTASFYALDINPTLTAVGSGGTRLLSLRAGSNDRFIVDNNGNITLNDGATIVLGTTTGTKIGTSASQKLGFYNATPVAQQTGVAVSAAAIHAALVSLGLITA